MSFYDDKNVEDEDTILSKLRIYSPDGIGSAKFTTHFVKVSAFKDFRITADSDTDLKLRLEWSIDGEDVNFYNEYEIVADVCLMKQVDVVLQYVRFFVDETLSEKQNCRLKIMAFSPDDKPVVKEPPHKKGFLSAAKNFSPKINPLVSPKSKKRDPIEERLPCNIYKGSLLVGKNTKELGVIAKGNESDILMIVDGSPQWVSLITLFSRHDELQKKEREKFVQFIDENLEISSSMSVSGSATPSPLTLPVKTNLSRSKSSLASKKSSSSCKADDKDVKSEENMEGLEMDGIYDRSVSKATSKKYPRPLAPPLPDPPATSSQSSSPSLPSPSSLYSSSYSSPFSSPVPPSIAQSTAPPTRPPNRPPAFQ